MSDLPQNVCKLLSEHIASVGQLELLLMLHGSPGNIWQAADASRALYTSEETVATQLADLHQHGFVVLESGAPGRYRYEPRTADLKQAVADLEAAYKERRVAIINFIYSAPVDKVRTFSDAFRFRKGP